MMSISHSILLRILFNVRFSQSFHALRVYLYYGRKLSEPIAEPECNVMVVEFDQSTGLHSVSYDIDLCVCCSSSPASTWAQNFPISETVKQ